MIGYSSDYKDMPRGFFEVLFVLKKLKLML